MNEQTEAEVPKNDDHANKVNPKNQGSIVPRDQKNPLNVPKLDPGVDDLKEAAGK